MSWTPGMRDWIANLDRTALDDPETELSLEPSEGVRLVRAYDGKLRLHLACTPTDVVTDTSGLSLRVVRDDSGAVITVAPTVPREIAAPVLDDVLTLLDEGVPPGVAGEQCIQRWRDLVANQPGRRLDEKAQAGLFGELSILRTILDHGGDPDSWTGWNNDPKDFRLPGLALEVKTTTSPNFRRVKVHGLRQLDRPIDGSDVVLVLERLETSPDGTSLPELIDHVRERSTSGPALLERLLDAGYSEAHRSHYTTRFVSEQVALRRINDAHPRLVPGMLRDVDLQAIGAVMYDLDLNGTEVDDLDQSLEGLIADAIAGP